MHPTTISGMDAQALAKVVGNLRYDVLTDFLSALSDDLARQAKADYEQDHRKLATALRQVRSQLKIAALYMKDAWTICEPFMKEEPSKSLSEEDAVAMLGVLSKHYQEPVMPIKKYCKGILDWFDAIITLNVEADEKEAYRLQGSDYWKHLGHIRTDMQKSNLLWRLFYMGQPLRTTKCPIHKGHWDGQTMMAYGCVEGCGGTGWLPNTPEEIEARAWVHSCIRWKDTPKTGAVQMTLHGNPEVYTLQIGDNTRVSIESPQQVAHPVTYNGIRFEGKGPNSQLIPGCEFELFEEGVLIAIGVIQMADPKPFPV